MATATRYITQSDITYVEVLVNDQDIRVDAHEDGRRCIKLGGVYAYLDPDGVTKLLQLLLTQPEASERADVFGPLLSAAVQAQYALEQKAV